jgi:dolichyl-phosphate-mannose--protein O-mannosyl transferase
MWFLPLCPWILTNRDSYIYHYLPSYVFGVILFGGLASTLPRAKARFALVAVVMTIFVVGVRLWSKIPLDADSLLHSLFFR